MLRAIQRLCPCCDIFDEDPELLVEEDYETGEVIGQNDYEIGEVTELLVEEVYEIGEVIGQNDSEIGEVTELLVEEDYEVGKVIGQNDYEIGQVTELLVEEDCEIGEVIGQNDYEIGEVIGQGRFGVVEKDHEIGEVNGQKDYEIGEVIEQGRFGVVEKDYEIGEVIGQKDYEIGEVIGQGRFGVVYKCTHRTTGEQFACKEMPITKNANHEIHVLQFYLYGRHPGILQFKARYCPVQDRMPKNVYMISELCEGGDLQHLLDEHGHGILSERQTARIINCLVQSLQFCHSRKIIHRDVKPSSILIVSSVNSSSWPFRLGNFDVAIWKGNRNMAVDNVGTLGYSAPEMLHRDAYSYEVDIWSAGVVLYVLLCGRTPFDAENEDADSMYRKIQNTEPDVSSGVWSTVSDSAKELVIRMLQKDRRRRLSCEQILKHPWILAVADMDLASSSTISMDLESISRFSTITTDIASSSTINRDLDSSSTITTDIASSSTITTDLASSSTINTENASTRVSILATNE